MTLREIYDVCVPQNKRQTDRLNPWLYYVIRPISILLTKPFLKSNIAPTTVTAISIIVTLLGFIFISFATSISLKVVGWLGFFLWAILDCVDGNIARCKNLTSKRGELWDATGGYIALALIFFSAGIIAYYEIGKYVLCNPEWYLIFGGLASVLSILPRLVAQKKKAISSHDSVKDVMDKSKFSLIKIIALNIESAIGIMQVVFLLCLLFHMMNVFVIFYFIINLMITIYSLYSLLK